MSLAKLVIELQTCSIAELRALDVELSEQIWGDDGHTISYHLGVLEAAGNPTAHAVCDILARFLGPNHCQLAVEHETPKSSA